MCIFDLPSVWSNQDKRMDGHFSVPQCHMELDWASQAGGQVLSISCIFDLLLVYPKLDIPFAEPMTIIMGTELAINDQEIKDAH